VKGISEDARKDVVLLALAMAHPGRLLTEDVGQKAGKMGSSEAKQVLGDLLLKGFVDGSDTTGFLITDRGREFVQNKFEEGRIGDYQTFAPRNAVQSKINARAWISALVVGLLLLIGILALSACATPARMHDEAQLNGVALGCGLALGELIQDQAEKKLLLTIRQDASVEQRACVSKWARRNGLKAVFVNMQFPEAGS
jgi:hypothetical protein